MVGPIVPGVKPPLKVADEPETVTVDCPWKEAALTKPGTMRDDPEGAETWAKPTGSVVAVV